MRDVRLVALLVAFVPFLYMAAVVSTRLPLLELPIVLAGAALAVGLGLYYLWGEWLGSIIAPAGILVLVLLFLVAAGDPSVAGGVGVEVALGALLAAPIVVLLVFSQPDRGPGARLVGLQLAFLDALAVLAAEEALVSGGEVVTSANLVTGYLSAIHVQILGLETLVTGGVPASLPLAGVNDPGFISLAGFALLVTLLTLVRPVTGRDVELPLVPGARPVPSVPEADLSGLSPSFVALLQSRSEPEGAPRGEFPGFAALVAGIAAGLLFVGVVYELRWWTFIMTAVGALAVVAASVGVLSRPLREPTQKAKARRTRSGAPAVSSGAGEE